MGKGVFGRVFDFDNDGEMNSFERAAESMYLHSSYDSNDDTSDGYGSGDYASDDFDSEY